MCVVVILGGIAHADEKPTLLHTAPTTAPAAQPLVIEGTLVGVNQVSRVFIRYRGPGESYADAEMELQYGDLYRGSIPASKLVPPGVEYYVEGLLRSGERVPLFRDAQKPARVFVEGEAPSRERAEASNKRSDRRHKDNHARDDHADDARARNSQDPSEPVVVDEDEPPSVDPLPGGRLDQQNAKADSELEEDLALYSAVDTVALATRHEEKVTRVPAIASSFNRDQIRALGARSVYDVLDVVPGLSISRDVQGFYRTAVRGLRSDPEVLFLLNGHPLNDVFDGRALANLPVENIERIEVIRGPGSALYGTGAFLGVVNVVTSTNEDTARAAVSGGSFGALDGHVDLSHRYGAFRVFGDADVNRQTGYQKPILKDALNSQTIQQGIRTDLDPAGITHDDRFFVNVGGGTRFDAGSAGELGVSLRFMSEQRSALVGLFDTVGPDSDLGWQVLLGDVSWQKSLGANTTLQARAFFDDQSMDRLFQLTPAGFSDAGRTFDSGLFERTRFGTRNFGAEVGADIQLVESNRLSIGAIAEQSALTRYAYETNFTIDSAGAITDYLGQTFQRPREDFLYPQEMGDGAAASRLILGLYAQDQWTVVDRLTMTFGFRLDATQLPTVDGDGSVSGKSFVPSFNPRAGLVWAVSDPLVIKLLYGHAFRSPTVQELAEYIPSTDYSQGRFEGNPKLDPATVDTVELGADLVQAAGDARVRLRGNAFFESFSNPIAAVDDTGNVTPLRNRSLGVRVFGAEAEARLEASDRANAWVNVSWFRALDLDSTLPLLTDTPQLRMNAGMSMPIGRYLNFDLLAKVGVERRNNSRSELEYTRRYRLPSYTLIGAQIRSEELFEHMEIALSGSNLLDFDYQDDAPRPDRMPGMVPREGLAAFLTVRAHL